MTEQLTLDDYRDVCRNRHGGNANSRAANARLAPVKTKQREEVFRAIILAGDAGLTCKELAAVWGVDMNKISGRFSELKADGRIVQVARRDGCSAYSVAPSEELARRHRMNSDVHDSA